MKKNNLYKMFLGLSCIFVACFAQAQVEISPYLDKNGATNGINYAPTTVNGVSVSGIDSTMSYYAAIQACRDLVYNGRSDWYLPSFEELVLFLPAPKADGTLDASTVQWSGCTPPNKATSGGSGGSVANNNDRGCNISMPYTTATTPVYSLIRNQKFHVNFYAMQAIRSVGSVYKAGMVPYVKPLAFYTSLPVNTDAGGMDLTLVGFGEQSAPFLSVQCVR